jgi:hypothetical protein
MKGETVKTIFSFETPSSTEWQAFNYPQPFIPNFFIPINTADLAAKIAGMECYQYEKREYPHPRSPEALEVLARRWGVATGNDYAEAFILIRSIL